LCSALQEASRAVSRLYDGEMRAAGLRTTQYALLRRLAAAGEIRQRDLGALASLEDSSLTRNLRPLLTSGWIAISSGQDRREKIVRLTKAGTAKLEEAHPAWERAQERMRSALQDHDVQGLLSSLPALTRLVEEA
jgi:DNA-binding MarR family transcriptional regulator